MIITALAVHQAGLPAALELLRWITELGGVQHRTLVLATTSNTDAAPLIAEARKSWGRVEHFTINLPQDTLPWPIGNNVMFHAVCLFMQRFSQPFFWMEPDVFPTRPSWLDELDVEYAGSGKLFMGAMSMAFYQGREVPDTEHMNGAGVYPPNVLKYLPTAAYLTTAIVEQPWDWALRWEMRFLVDGNGGFKVGADGARVSICHPSKLICLCYKSYNFRLDYDGDPHCDAVPLCNYRQLDLRQHVLHHGCKDGSLLTLLRARLQAERGNFPTVLVPAPPLPQTPTPPPAPRAATKRRKRGKKMRRRKRTVPLVMEALPAPVN